MKRRRLIIRDVHAPLIGAMTGRKVHKPSEQSMIDETWEYCLKMMYVLGELNVMADYLAPAPKTAIYASLTTTPAEGFKVEKNFYRFSWRWGSRRMQEITIIEERCSLVKLLDGETGSFTTASARSSVGNVPWTSARWTGKYVRNDKQCVFLEQNAGRNH